MLAILQFYVSSFWAWAGITIGMGIAVQSAVMLVTALRR